MTVDPFSFALTRSPALLDRLAVEARDEQELLPAMLQDVDRFCAEQVDGARIDREGRLGAALLEKVAARGWFGLTVPADFGGAGLSLAAAARIVTALAGHNGSLGTCVGLHSGLALHALLHQGSAALQARYLPEVAAGARIAAFAATEPEAGSDISAVRTTLREVDGQLRLDGDKCYVTNGGICGLVTVLARSPGLGGARAGHTLVLVDPEAPGVSRGREEHKLGLKGSSTVTLTFDGVVVPPEHVLGELSQGLGHAHAALCWGRTFMAAGCLGSAQAALRQVREHTVARRQFGRSLAQFPLVRQALARAKAELHAVESTLRLVCAVSDARLGDLALPSAMVKVLASEAAFRVVDDALQLMGGAGYIEDAGMARRLRDVRITRIFEGANDVLRLSIAASALAWPVARLHGATTVEGLPEPLRAEALELDARLGQLVQALVVAKKRWGFRLFEQQAVAVALADAITHAFAALAVLQRARSTAANSTELAVARLALRCQLERVSERLERVAGPADSELDALTEQVGRQLTGEAG